MSQNESSPEMMRDAFRLFLKYRGKQMMQIEREMHSLGWTDFKIRLLYNYNKRKDRNKGWIDRYGWRAALEIKDQVEGFAATSLPDQMFYEVESIRRSLFENIIKNSVTDGPILTQHERYTQRSMDIHDRRQREKEKFKDPMYFLRQLIKDAPAISKDLAKALADSEEALLKWVIREHAVD